MELALQCQVLNSNIHCGHTACPLPVFIPHQNRHNETGSHNRHVDLIWRGPRSGWRHGMVLRRYLHNLQVRSSDTEPILTSKLCVGACQIGSGAFGDWFWWLYMIVRRGDTSSRSSTDILSFQIPVYAVFKLWTSAISPLLLGRSSSAPTADAADDKEPAASKRQEKLRKRNERGDPRVRGVPVKK